MKRTTLTVLVLTAVCAVAFAVVAGAFASPSKKTAGPLAGQRFYLMIQSTPTASKVLQDHVIQILKRQGADAQIKWNGTSSNVAIAQLESGDVDGFSNAVAGGLGAAIAGIPIVDFALVNPREDYVFLTRPDVTSLSQLKGKSIGVLDTTSINYPQELIVLKKAGLTAGDVHTVIAGGQSSRLAALVSGRLDGTMLSHAAAIQLQPQGYHVLYDFTKQSAYMYDDNIFATKTWLAAHKTLAVAVNKAILQSFVWFNNPKNADAVVKEAVALAPGTDAAQTKQLFDTLRSLHWAVEKAVLNIKTLKYEAQLFQQVGAVKGSIPVGRWANVYYANAAKAALYPPKKK
jgi:ABC-type nitrate/sulfonate/bicarbonate transport system substrate-binding protein